MMMLKEGRTHTGRIEDGAKEVREQCEFMECFPRFCRFAYFIRNKIRLCGSMNYSHVLNPTISDMG